MAVPAAFVEWRFRGYVTKRQNWWVDDQRSLRRFSPI